MFRASDGIALGPQSRRAIYGSQSVPARHGHGAARKPPHATVFGGKCVPFCRTRDPGRCLKLNAAAIRGGRVAPPVLGTHQQRKRRPGSDRRRRHDHQLDRRTSDDGQRGRLCQRDERAVALRIHGHPEIPLGLQKRLRSRTGTAPAAVAVDQHQPLAGLERAAVDHQQDRGHLLDHDRDARVLWRLHGHVVCRRRVVELGIRPVRIALRKHADATAGSDPPLADDVRQPLGCVAAGHHLAGRVEEHPPIGLSLCVRRTRLHHRGLRLCVVSTCLRCAEARRACGRLTVTLAVGAQTTRYD